MIRLVLKIVLPLVVVLVVAIVGYNYFAGTAEEKAEAKKIFQQFKDLGSSVANLLSNEIEKYDQGKYSKAMADISQGVDAARKHANSLKDGGKKWMGKINELEQQKKVIEDQLSGMAAASDRGDPDDSNMMQQLSAQIKNLATETQKLTEQMGGSQ